MADLHRDPERLRAHAARAEELADLLRARSPGADLIIGSRRRSAGCSVSDGVERLAAATADTAGRLAELARELRDAAAGAEAADRYVRRDFLYRDERR